MIYIGIDVAKDNHDCFITNFNGKCYLKHSPLLTTRMVSTIFFEFLGADHVANAHLTRLTNLLSESSKGRYSKETVITFRNAARTSIGSDMSAKSLELKHTIKLIQELTFEIDEIKNEISLIMDEFSSPILSIPRINYRMVTMIIAEISDFNRFDSPDKILVNAGFSPSTYQSGQLGGTYSLTWKSETPDIYDMPYTTLPNMSATGIQRLLNTWQRNEQKASITMLLYLMLSKNGSELFTILMNIPDGFTSAAR